MKPTRRHQKNVANKKARIPATVQKISDQPREIRRRMRNIILCECGNKAQKGCTNPEGKKCSTCCQLMGFSCSLKSHNAHANANANNAMKRSSSLSHKTCFTKKMRTSKSFSVTNTKVHISSHCFIKYCSLMCLEYPRTRWKYNSSRAQERRGFYDRDCYGTHVENYNQ